MLRTIRLEDAQIEELLRRRDALQSSNASERRRNQRVKYRLKGCVFQYHSHGCSEPKSYAIYPLDLSAEGFAFLHGGFVHPGTPCVVQLMSPFGTWTEVKGIVHRCEFLQGNIHEVAVKLLQRIEPADFSPDAFKPRVLLVDDQSLTLQLSMKILKDLNAEVETAVNGKLAIELAQGNSYDAILMDLEMPVMDGYESVRLLREAGYSGTIVALTAMTRPEDEAKCRGSGFDGYLRKPCDKVSLSNLIQSLRKEPLLSSMCSDPDMVPLIAEFVSALQGSLREVEKLLAEQKLMDLEIALRNIKGSAGGFGFEPISQAAGKAEDAIISKANIEAIRRMTVETLKLARLARAPSVASSETA